MSPEVYSWLTAAHLIGVFFWIGGLMAVYWLLRIHSHAPADSHEKLILMERSLALMMDIAATLAIGAGLAMAIGGKLFSAPKMGWLHIKLTVVVLGILSVHGMVRARVFPFQPGETRRITMRYTQVLERSGDALVFSYASGSATPGGVVGPRPVPMPRPMVEGDVRPGVRRTTSDVPLTFEGTRAIGASLGSGVVMPFDDTVDLRLVLRRIAQFFRDESCGQCVPCRVGTVRQEEVLHRLATDRPFGSVKQELELVKELGQVMRDASICGLGQTASSAIESALARFPILQEKR
jgi:uncharacterized membrane protein